jgi:2-polyprenyl-6-methoxyphenol hydroxylase-like FAD-dependent oxidoreductase
MKRRDALKLLATGAVGALVSRKAGAEPDSPGEITWSRKVPVRYDTDVAVLGGGIAGVSAAGAAARAGAKVVLVERFAITGGNLTAGGVASFCGETAGQGEVFDEVLADLEKFKAIVPYKPYPQADHRVFDHHILAIVLQELLVRRKVKLLLHTRFVDARVTGGRITECLVCGKSGPEALRAKQFIDCTGDADVARAAGFAVMKGQPYSLPMSMMAFVRHVEKQEPQLPEGWFEPVKTNADLPMTSLWPNGRAFGFAWRSCWSPAFRLSGTTSRLKPVLQPVPTPKPKALGPTVPAATRSRSKSPCSTRPTPNR